MDRRGFLRTAGASAGLLLLNACGDDEGPIPGLRPRRRFTSLGGASGDVVVIGAGAFGGWTAYYLRRMGARVTLVDAYGPGNSRSTSGDETRGVRSSYGDRSVGGELWMQWARESMSRWKAFDEEWSEDLKTSLFHTTGDLIFREEWEPFTTKCREFWQKDGVRHEVLKPDEVTYRYPVIDIEGITAILSEPDAGVVRARRACQTVAAIFEHLGGTIMTGRVAIPKMNKGKLEEIVLDTGQKLRADTFVFALGPWLPKAFPELLGNRMRVPMGQVCYFGTPVNDERFRYPNLPSFNFPGVTGWPSLPVDNRGFRVRGSVRAPRPPGTPPDAPRPQTPRPPVPPAQMDPDTSERWFDSTRIEGPRRFLAMRFPLLAEAPVLQTHACHYESSSSNNFIFDRYPQMTNAWIAGAGNAEGFKFGPVVGEYVAQRVLGYDGDPAVDNGFKIPAKEYEIVPPATTPATPAMAGSAAPPQRVPARK